MITFQVIHSLIIKEGNNINFTLKKVLIYLVQFKMLCSSQHIQRRRRTDKDFFQFFVGDFLNVLSTVRFLFQKLLKT